MKKVTTLPAFTFNSTHCTELYKDNPLFSYATCCGLMGIELETKQSNR
jgi:hypothetical protein